MSNRYEEIIKHLRETEPVLDNEEGLTAAIVSKIKKVNPLSTKKTDVFKLLVRPAMTAAAVFLVGLFLFEQSSYTLVSKHLEISRTIAQKESLDTKQTLTKDMVLSEELKYCIKEARTNSKKMDRKCARKLFTLYRQMEKQQAKSYKQRLKNWFNQ